MGSEEAVAGLMDMRYGQDTGPFRRSPNAQLLQTRQIGNVTLTYDQINELFQQCVTRACVVNYLTDHRLQLLHLLPPFSSHSRYRKIP